MIGPYIVAIVVVYETVDPVQRIVNSKIIWFSVKDGEFYTEAIVVFINSDLALGFEFYLKSTRKVFQSSPCNFKTPYLFNRNSVLSDFCSKSFVATKPI
jgi:hypothetical protein